MTEFALEIVSSGLNVVPADVGTVDPVGEGPSDPGLEPSGDPGDVGG